MFGCWPTRTWAPAGSVRMSAVARVMRVILFKGLKDIFGVEWDFCISHGGRPREWRLSIKLTKKKFRKFLWCSFSDQIEAEWFIS